jgi:Sec-independent protein translocase protein TatA
MITMISRGRSASWARMILVVLVGLLLFTTSALAKKGKAGKKTKRTKRPKTDSSVETVSSLCPEELPDSFSSCQAEQASQVCPYDHIYTGCEFSEGFECTPQRTATCDSDLRWIVSTISTEECADPDPDSPFGQTCEPCAEVELGSICPATKPQVGQSCDYTEGFNCDYNYFLAGCTASTLQCTPLNLMSCISGVWREAVAGVEQCV